jgi:hypothetical protein
MYRLLEEWYHQKFGFDYGGFGKQSPGILNRSGSHYEQQRWQFCEYDDDVSFVLMTFHVLSQ